MFTIRTYYAADLDSKARNSVHITGSETYECDNQRKCHQRLDLADVRENFWDDIGNNDSFFQWIFYVKLNKGFTQPV